MSRTPVPPGMVRLDATPPLLGYLSMIWNRREFAWAIAIGQFRSQHMDTLLGQLWHVLNPILNTLIYYFIFGVVLGTSRGIDNFVGYLTVGVFMFSYSRRAITSGAGSITTNVGLIRSLQFPRAVLPLASLLNETVALLPTLLVMGVVLIATGEPLTWAWFALFPAVFLQAGFNYGAALIGARVADSVRDFLNVLPYIFRILFYVSGVFWSIEGFIQDPLLRRIFWSVPTYIFVDLARSYTMTSYQARSLAWDWLGALGWTVAMLTIGTWIFRAGEARYGRG